MAIILDGKALADKINLKLKTEINRMEKKPTLAVVLVGDNPASQIYVKNKSIKAQELGINSFIINLSADISQSWLETEIENLSKNDDIDAILLQLPLPEGLDAQKVIEKIPPEKDADGFHPYNLGKLFSGKNPYAIPCTPAGIMELLKEYNVDIEGKNVVIVGRSIIVGKPILALMSNENATVTLCHSKTQNLKEITQRADILIVAVGKPKFITTEYVKDGAVVVDVGINRVDGKKIVGDIDFENVKEKASYITPVPKGVGPMTIAMLMQNTVNLVK